MYKQFSALTVTNTLLCSAAAVALSPQAFAQQTTEISDDTTAPVLTSVTGDLTIASGGSITLDGGTAVTIDSDNSVAQGGSLVLGDADDAIALLIQQNTTFAYEQSGDIDMGTVVSNDDETPPDYGDNRSGVRLGAGPSTGSIALSSGGSIAVTGDTSQGIWIEGTQDGDLTSNGAIVIHGAGSDGVLISGTTTGDVLFDTGSTISVLGVESDGIDVSGSISGAFAYGGAITVTGFQDPTQDAPGSDGENNAAQAALTSGNAISISGDVGGGVLVAGVLPTEFSDVAGAPTTSASVQAIGSGNALRIDGGTGLSTIGPADTSALAGYGNFGVINRGVLQTSGGYEGVDTESVFIGSADIAGGFRNDRVIQTTAIDAAAVAVRLGAGATVPNVVNDGQIAATSNGLNASAMALRIDAGASLPSLSNLGSIEANAVSDTGDSVAVLDASGTLATISNTGLIVAGLGNFDDRDDTTDTDAGDAAGQAIALDLSANTTGVAYTATVSDDFDPDTQSRSAFGVTIGDVLLGSGDDTFIADAGTTTGDLFFGEGANTANFSNGADLTGDVAFGSGDDTFVVDNANITGAIDFGTGADVFALSNGASFTGTLASSAGLSTSLAGSNLSLTTADTFTMDSLVTDGTSTIGLTVAADGQSISSIDAATIDLASGTEINTLFEGAFANDLSAVIFNAGTLTAGDLDLNTEGLSPFLFEQSIVASGANELTLSLRRRTAEELGINDAFEPAYEPIIAALTADEALGAGLFNATTQDEFLASFRQILPEPLGAGLAYARAQNNSVTSMVTQRVESAVRGEGSQRRLWLQEGSFFVKREDDDATNGFDGGGFVLAGGVDTNIGPLDVFGLSGHFASARYDEGTGEDFPYNRLTFGGGVYAAEAFGPLEVDFSARYSMSNTESERVVQYGTERRLIDGEWDGEEITGHARVRYVTEVRGFDVVPFVSADFISLTEDAYTETGDASLAYTVEEREAESLRTAVGLTVGKTYESRTNSYDSSIPSILKPQITVAWSQELSGDDLSGTYTLPGGTAFTLEEEAESGSIILGGDLIYANQYANVQVGGHADFGDTNIYSLRVGVGLNW